MDLYPEHFKEKLYEVLEDEIAEFTKYLKDRGLWNDSMKIYKDKDGNLVAK